MKKKYNIVQEVIQQIEVFENENTNKIYSSDLNGFNLWICNKVNNSENKKVEPNWEGKENGRSPESIINTLIVHMNRYPKTYPKSAIHGSVFSTQEEFIYLILLKSFGSMSKMELIKKNIQEKPVGIQIINRLLKNNLITQTDSEIDKRSKIIQITETGLEVLEKQMSKIREATEIVTGNLSYNEKMELISLLNKLNDFHLPIYTKNIDSDELLEKVKSEYLSSKN